MNIEQADKILDYQKPPKKREEQVALISVMGYKKLNGGGGQIPISRCSNKQISSVARSLFYRAEKSMHQYWSEADEGVIVKNLYHQFLCEISNIPEDSEISIGELERELMQ